MTDDVTTPDVYDFTWVRGTNVPVIMSFTENGVAVPFDDARMSVGAGKTFLFRMSISDGGAQLTGSGEVTFTPTPEQTKLLKQTAIGEPGKNNYEVELRNGTSEKVYVMGTICGIGGLNDDEGVDAS